MHYSEVSTTDVNEIYFQVSVYSMVARHDCRVMESLKRNKELEDNYVVAEVINK